MRGWWTAAPRGLIAVPRSLCVRGGGRGESTTDLAWDGLTVIYESGVLRAESERFPNGDREPVADIDLEPLRHGRLRKGSFDDNRRAHARRTGNFREVPFRLGAAASDLGLRR